MTWNIKQVIVLCTELGMRRGKMVAQACHASVKAAMKSDMLTYLRWDEDGHKKVCLKVQTQDELVDLANQVGETLPCALIIDHGLTQIPAGSITAFAIGPATETEIDIFTKHLKLLQ